MQQKVFISVFYSLKDLSDKFLLVVTCLLNTCFPQCCLCLANKSALCFSIWYLTSERNSIKPIAFEDMENGIFFQISRSSVSCSKTGTPITLWTSFQYTVYSLTELYNLIFLLYCSLYLFTDFCTVWFELFVLAIIICLCSRALMITK